MHFCRDRLRSSPEGPWASVRVAHGRSLSRGASIVIADVDDAKGWDLASALKDAGSDALFVHTDVTIQENIGSCIEALELSFAAIDSCPSSKRPGALAW